MKDLKTKVKAIEDDILNSDKVSANLIELKYRSRRINPQMDGAK